MRRRWNPAGSSICSPTRARCAASIKFGRLLGLTSCAASATPPITIEALACPPSLRAAVPAQLRLPDGADLVSPVGDERPAYEAFLGTVVRLRGYAEDMAVRARTAKTWCDAQASRADQS